MVWWKMIIVSLLEIERKRERESLLTIGYDQGLVKGAKLCLNPYFFGWLEKWVGWLQKYSLHVENKSKDQIRDLFKVKLYTIRSYNIRIKWSRHKMGMELDNNK